MHTALQFTTGKKLLLLFNETARIYQKAHAHKAYGTAHGHRKN